MLAHIQAALEIFEETRADGYRLKDSPKLMWRAFRKLGWTPSPDIFDKMIEGDVVVIYSADQKQVFQNINFFDWVSITLEDLYATPWNQYSKRDSEIEKRLHQEQEFVSRLVTSFPDVIAVLDREARYTYISGRIRDVLAGPDGNLYLLLQNMNGDQTGGSIIRLVPAN